MSLHHSFYKSNAYLHTYLTTTLHILLTKSLYSTRVTDSVYRPLLSKRKEKNSGVDYIDMISFKPNSIAIVIGTRTKSRTTKVTLLLPWLTLPQLYSMKKYWSPLYYQ